MKLRTHRLAVAEIDHEVDYYESCSAGLGVELEDEIDAAIDHGVFHDVAPDDLGCLRAHPSGAIA